MKLLKNILLTALVVLLSPPMYILVFLFSLTMLPSKKDFSKDDLEHLFFLPAVPTMIAFMAIWNKSWN